MDFGLFYYCQGRGVPHDQAYHEMLDEIALAETLGFGECWFAEHHFTDYSLLPSPNLMIASAIPRTRRMRFGNYVNALSFHHPLRLAAEAAMLDNLARGRFDFGVGKGVRPGEFAQLGIQFEDGVPMTEESIEIILKVWTEERTSHAGRFWRFPELSLRPRIYQRPHPPLHEWRAGRPRWRESARAAGPWRCTSRRRRSWPGSVEEYRAALAKRAEPRGQVRIGPGSLLCRETYVAETEEVRPGRGSAGAPGLLASLLPGRLRRRRPNSPMTRLKALTKPRLGRTEPTTSWTRSAAW